MNQWSGTYGIHPRLVKELKGELLSDWPKCITYRQLTTAVWEKWQIASVTHSLN